MEVRPHKQHGARHDADVVAHQEPAQRGEEGENEHELGCWGQWQGLLHVGLRACVGRDSVSGTPEIQ